ncbi:hypothetical protein F5Y09DRAFT_294430 [Xylaria sp. FL1042]|nr:hypothetical protein F5Y09DRAFT_294430 [Xylaria sp. FL1042]
MISFKFFLALFSSCSCCFWGEGRELFFLTRPLGRVGQRHTHLLTSGAGIVSDRNIIENRVHLRDNEMRLRGPGITHWTLVHGSLNGDIYEGGPDDGKYHSPLDINI